MLKKLFKSKKKKKALKTIKKRVATKKITKKPFKKTSIISNKILTAEGWLRKQKKSL